MTKKILFTSLILFCFVLSGMAGECFADVSAELEQAKLNVISLVKDGNYAEAEVQTQKLLADFSEHKDIAKAVCQVADQYYQLQRHQQADKLYQEIVERWPGDEYAMWSQMHIAMSNTRDGNDAAAEAATNKLIANYSGYKPIARAVCQIADQYYQSQRHQNADKLYQKIVEKWPDTGDAMWAQMHIAMSNIRDGNVAAEAATDKLLTNYAGQENITEAACQIADQYSQSQKYQQADKLYQEIIERCGAKHAILAKAGMVKLNILLGNEAAAEAAINKLITDFSGHPDLPRTLLIIGEEYYKKGLSKESEGPADQARDHFEKAVKMWGRLINEFPNSALIPETCCWAGDCYHKLGQYEKSIQCFQKVVDNYPGYEYAWHAQFMVGRCYEGLKDTGAIEKSVADAQINTAYEQLLKKYPDCPVAEYARVWMSRYGSK